MVSGAGVLVEVSMVNDPFPALTYTNFPGLRVSPHIGREGAVAKVIGAPVTEHADVVHGSSVIAFTVSVGYIGSLKASAICVSVPTFTVPSAGESDASVGATLSEDGVPATAALAGPTMPRPLMARTT